MTPATALRLGRVSNLPTVWTNVLAGVALAGVSPWQWATVPAAAGVSLAYVGGMFLNDAFDRDIDAEQRPSRPIPSGAVAANTVFAAGFVLLLGAVAVLLMAARGFSQPPQGVVLAGLALAGAVVAYSWHHKANPLSPAVMGACRLLAYLAAGLAAAAALSRPLLGAALVSCCYLLGLTYAAKGERGSNARRVWPLLFLAAPVGYGAVFAEGVTGRALLALLVAWIGGALWLLRRRRPGDVGRAVVALIAGIALLDALFLAVAGWPGAAPAAIGCFLATLTLQRWISGT
jgi:hypothetical protein